VNSEAPGYIGPYRLLNVVNTGQNTQMWQAFHDGEKCFYGIKVLLDKFRRNREQTNYLRWEHTVGAKLKDERIIRIIEFKFDRGTPYLAMEWFSAPNLKQLVRQGVETYEYLVPQIIDQATGALAYFNEQGWIHRDIKPDNFLASDKGPDKGKVKLIDFALAQKARRGIGKLFASKPKVQGTRSYMAPEQIRGESLDYRSDLYSLACTFYELVSGKPPFTGTSANDLLMKHLKAPPPPLESANPNVTPQFAQLLRKAMAKKPENRPNSVGDFLTAIRMAKVYRRPPSPPSEGDDG